MQESLSSTSNGAVVDFLSQQAQIRCLLSGRDDIQKLRISTGNRIVQSFYKQLGIQPGETIDSAEGEGKKLLARITDEYKLISESVVENQVTIKKAISNLISESDSKLHNLTSVADYELVESYKLLEESEKKISKSLQVLVESHPMWDYFFKDVKGCGYTMAGVCIAYLNPHKARHVSSFFRYIGLDTVQDKDDNGNLKFRAKDGTRRVVIEKYVYVDALFGTILEDEKKIKAMKETDEEIDGQQVYVSGITKYFRNQSVTSDGSPIYLCEDGTEYCGEVERVEHGRRKGDVEMQQYTDRDGNLQWKRGLTYNPYVKTKLMGVLAGSFVKIPGCEYRKIYDDYKFRRQNSVDAGSLTAGHLNSQAQRYMIKQFVRNMWVSWRTLEGLEVDMPYEVAKLGHKPHKYNEYQCHVADKQA